jgi:hypothetical protein
MTGIVEQAQTTTHLVVQVLHKADNAAPNLDPLTLLLITLTRCSLNHVIVFIHGFDDDVIALLLTEHHGDELVGLF